LATSISRPGTRLDALDAVRGVAALVVVLHHLAHTFWPAALHATAPWRSAFDGSFAVTIFFVLSGSVLSIAYFERPVPETLADAALRRYVRLTVPVLASVLLGYVVLRFGAFANVAAADVMGRGPDQWLRHFYGFAPRVWDALAEGTYRVYLTYDSSHSYNAVLWTMGVEFSGSFFVLAFLALAGGLRRRWLVYLVVAAVLHSHWPYALHFMIGVALCDVYVRARRAPRRRHLGGIAGTALLVLGVFVGSAAPGWFGERLGVGLAARRLDCQSVGAALVVAVALFCPVWQRVLRLSWLTGLGRVSFSLYLVHQIIICSVGCRLFLLARQAWGWPFPAAAAAAATVAVAVSLAAAWGMTRTVDRWAIALARAVSRFVRGPNRADAKTRRARGVPAIFARRVTGLWRAARAPVGKYLMFPQLRAISRR
jgi:peptidoglycan/LPS O-acetylase OafA/YrhL